MDQGVSPGANNVIAFNSCVETYTVNGKLIPRLAFSAAVHFSVPKPGVIEMKKSESMLDATSVLI